MPPATRKIRKASGKANAAASMISATTMHATPSMIIQELITAWRFGSPFPRVGRLLTKAVQDRSIAGGYSIRAPVSAVAQGQLRSGGIFGAIANSKPRSLSLFALNTSSTASWLTGSSSPATPTS